MSRATGKTKTITKDQLKYALARWELDARMGRCIPIEESKSQSVAQVATESAERLWLDLDTPIA